MTQGVGAVSPQIIQSEKQAQIAAQAVVDVIVDLQADIEEKAASERELASCKDSKNSAKKCEKLRELIKTKEGEIKLGYSLLSTNLQAASEAMRRRDDVSHNNDEILHQHVFSDPNSYMELRNTHNRRNLITGSEWIPLAARLTEWNAAIAKDGSLSQNHLEEIQVILQNYADDLYLDDHTTTIDRQKRVATESVIKVVDRLENLKLALADRDQAKRLMDQAKADLGAVALDIAGPSIGSYQELYAQAKGVYQEHEIAVRQAHRELLTATELARQAFRSSSSRVDQELLNKLTLLASQTTDSLSNLEASPHQRVLRALGLSATSFQFAMDNPWLLNGPIEGFKTYLNFDEAAFNHLNKTPTQNP